MLYMHVCSVLCASGTGGCCNKSNEKKNANTKSCCSHKKESNSKDCQDFHLSFFKTTGQFANDINPELIKQFQDCVTITTWSFTDLLFDVDNNQQVNNFYHPPPFKPKVPLYLLDRVFLI